jgi:serine/threonine-protein kinase RsbW
VPPKRHARGHPLSLRGSSPSELRGAWDPVAGIELAEIPNIFLSLSSRAENVLLVRQALSGLAEATALNALELNDISTAVSEACNNVVLHAYNGGEGPLEVEIGGLPHGLRVIVRDRGRGINALERSGEHAGAGIGLPVIRALAQQTELRDLGGGGTEVVMDFATTGAIALEEPRAEELLELPQILDDHDLERLRMRIAPPSLAATVLARVLCALGARAHFSTDHLSDTGVLADALATRSEDSLSTAHLNVTVRVASRELEFWMGPLQTGRAEALLRDAAADGLGAVLERLTEGHRVMPAAGGEMLSLHLADRR